MRIEEMSQVSLPISNGTTSTSASERDFALELWDIIGHMNGTQKQSQNDMQNAITGKTDDYAGALVALEKASLQLEIATTVRDKAVYAFNKLMDTQI